MNNGDGTFTQDTSSALANHLGYTFGSAFGDYDNDGWLDIILANTLGENQENSLYHNTGSGNNWIKILLKGTTSNASAIGAKLRVNAVIDGNSVWQTRGVTAASGYCSQNSFNNHFGLGDADIVSDIEVTWPSGAVESFTEIDINKRYIIEEGNGIFLGNNDVGTTPWKITIFPNPTSDIINIQSKINITQIDVYNQLGQLIKTNTNQNWIDISSVDQGIYFINVTNENGNNGTLKVVKS